MQIYPEAEPFTHLAKVPFGVKQYSCRRQVMAKLS